MHIYLPMYMNIIIQVYRHILNNGLVDLHFIVFRECDIAYIMMRAVSLVHNGMWYITHTCFHAFLAHSAMYKLHVKKAKILTHVVVQKITQVPLCQE